jgi:hypothetical protein
MMNKLSIALIIIVSISGCTSTNNKEEDIDKDRIDLVLRNAANHIQESAYVQRENSNAKAYKVLSDEQHKELALESMFVPDGLEKHLKISWRGDIEGLLKLVADMTGYKYVPVTQQTKGPVLVNVVASTNVTAFEIIRAAGIQAGDRALVEVIPKGFVKSREDVGLIKLTRR